MGIASADQRMKSVRVAIYQTLLQEILDESSQQSDIIGILLTGSVARGDVLPGSNLDLRFLLTSDSNRSFSAELRQGILVERGYADMSKALSKLDSNPMEVYAYLDGRVLFDPQGALADLTEQARQRFAVYRVPDDE
jgi:predicted nucleotidyltransferase